MTCLMHELRNRKPAVGDVFEARAHGYVVRVYRLSQRTYDFELKGPDSQYLRFVTSHGGWFDMWPNIVRAFPTKALFTPRVEEKRQKARAAAEAEA